MIKLENYLEKPYIKFILWLLTGISILLFGILNVNAATYYTTDFTAQLYDNYGPSLSPVTTSLTNNRYQGMIPTMSANTSGGAWGVSSPITLLANHTYTITTTIDGTFGGNIILSTYNRIGVGTTLQNAVNSYVNNTYVSEAYSRALGDGMTLQFAFTPSINSSYIVFPFATSSGGNNWTFSISSIIVDDLGTDGVTQDEINNSLNNQTQIIQNSINNIENSINNTITENFNDCYTNIFNSNSYTSSSFTSISISNNNITASSSSSWKTITYNFSVVPNEVYTLYYTSPDDIAVYYYNPDNVDFSRLKQGLYTQITPTTNNLIIRLQNSESGTVHFNNLMLVKGNVSRFISYGEQYCSNKIDSTNDKLDQTNKELGDLNDNLTNDNVSGVDSAFDSFEGFLEENSTITKLIILPITLYTSILNNVNGSCMPFNLGTLYGVNLSLPCVNIGSYLGTTLWTMIDIIISGFAVYFISKKLVKIFNNVSSMKEGDVIDD